MNTKSVLPAEVDPSPYVAYAQQALQSVAATKREQEDQQQQQWLDSIADDPRLGLPEDAAARKEAAKIPDDRAVKADALYWLWALPMCINRYMPLWLAYSILAACVFVMIRALWRLHKIRKR